MTDTTGTTSAVDGLSPHDAGVIDNEAQPQLDAYALLTKPTLDLTDKEVDIIVENLRKRRTMYLTSKKPDAPAKEAKQARLAAAAVTKEKPSAAEKAANTAALLDSIDWKL